MSAKVRAQRNTTENVWPKKTPKNNRQTKTQIWATTMDTKAPNANQQAMHGQGHGVGKGKAEQAATQGDADKACTHCEPVLKSRTLREECP